MYNEYEESFYYDDNGSSGAGTTAGSAIGLAGGLIALAIYVVSFVTSRFDILSSGLLALLAYMLTFQRGWSNTVYIAGVLLIFGISMLLQHLFKIVRIIYGVFVSVIAAILGPMVFGYESNAELYKIMAICFSVTAVWGYFAWKTYKE